MTPFPALQIHSYFTLARYLRKHHDFIIPDIINLHAAIGRDENGQYFAWARIGSIPKDSDTLFMAYTVEEFMDGLKALAVTQKLVGA